MKRRNPEDFYSRPEIAAKLGVNVSTLKNWEKARKGPRVIRVSERVALYPKAAFAEYLFTHSTESVPLCPEM